MTFDKLKSRKRETIKTAGKHNRAWEIKKLGEVAIVSAGNSAPQKKELFENGIYPFFRTSDVGQIKKGFIKTSVDNLNDNGIKKLKLFKEGTILFPKSGASTFLNHRVMMKVDGYVSSHLATIKAKSQIIDDLFLFYYLITIDAKDLMQNIAYPSLKISDIDLIPVPAPPLPEQQRIVTILDQCFAAIDKAKANAEQNLKNAKELFESYLQGVFASTGSASKGDGWEEKNIKEVCELKSGTTISSNLERTEGDILYVKVGDMNLPENEVEIYTSSRFVNRDEIKPNQIIPIGAIIFPKRGGAISTNKKRKIIKPTIVDLNTMAIIPGSKIETDYFFHWFRLIDLNNISNGTSIPQINNYSFDHIKIPFPISLQEQQTIVRQLDALRAETQKLEAIYQKKIVDLEELKKEHIAKGVCGGVNAKRNGCMKIKHHKIVTPEGKPFENCKLNRKQYAEVLTSIVSTYADGFVLAINNEWGTGKTTFVEMWQQQLKNEGFQTIYFNAWENDFDNNPLVAIMAELKSLTKSNDNTFNSVLQKGAVLVKSVGPELLKALLNKYTGLDKTSLETIKNSAEGITEILKDEIEDYANKKKTIVEFRVELAQFVKKKSNDKPLVFIIDELDRCRPDYAVEVLEQMKHFFTVPGIVFVLSIDKNHLASSVRGFYGSEHINTDEYLRRFIDLEYSIPQPKTEDFIDYLYDYYSFDDFFYSKERQGYRNIQRDSSDFLFMTKYLLQNSNSTLRQQEKIFAYTRLVLCSFRENEYVFPALLFVLMYLKSMKLDTYKKIETKQLSLQELSDVFTGLFNGVKDNDINFSYIEAQLLWFYNNNREYPYKENNIFTEDDNRKPITAIKSKLEENNSKYNLADYFKVISEERYNRFKLDFLLHKINLTQPIVTQKSKE